MKGEAQSINFKTNNLEYKVKLKSTTLIIRAFDISHSHEYEAIFERFCPLLTGRDYKVDRLFVLFQKASTNSLASDVLLQFPQKTQDKDLLIRIVLNYNREDLEPEEGHIILKRQKPSKEIKKRDELIASLFQKVNLLEEKMVKLGELTQPGFPGIGDDQFSASSNFNADHDIRGCRLNTFRPGGVAHSWCALPAAAGQWIQVNYKQAKKILGFATQGRGNLDQWVTSYELQISSDGIYFQSLGLFGGNSDRNTVVHHFLPEPKFAVFVRLVCLSFNGHPSLRWHVLLADNQK